MSECPPGYNLSYLAAERVLKETELDIQGESFVLMGDSVPTHGFSVALLHAGASNVRMGAELEVKQTEATSAGHELLLDIRHHGGMGFEALEGDAADPTTEDGLRRLFWAERLRQIIELCQGHALAQNAASIAAVSRGRPAITSEMNLG